MRICLHSLTLMGAIVVALCTDSVAATYVWNGTGSAANTNNWRVGGLTPTAPPGASDDILLDNTSVGPVDWDLNTSVQNWTQKSNYTGTVTFRTVYVEAGQGTFTNFVISGNCVISNGVWTHLSNAGAANRRWYRLRVTVGGDFILGSNATITAVGLGYQASSGPGYPGSHGGQLSQTYVASLAPANTYGAVTAPIEPGSGGYWGGSNDADGGGAVHITVGGAATIEGTISVRAKNSGGANGAGGSIFLTVGSLSGSGTLDACAVQSNSGGGGRMALIVTNSASWGSVIMKAYGGPTGPGAAGTVYRESTAHTPGHGILRIDNNNYADANLIHPYFSYAATLMPTSGAYNGAVNLGDFSDIIVTNKGVLGINRDTTLNLSTANFRFAGRDNSYMALRGTNNTTFPAAFSITNFTLLVDTPVSVAGDWTVTSQGRIADSISRESSTYSDTGGYPFQGPLTLFLGGNLTVDAGGIITVEGAGYRCSDGPAWANGNRAAGHGGQGGVSDTTPGKTYGSVTNPVTAGSGGYWGNENMAEGGGVMRLDVAGQTTVNGDILARGWVTDGEAGGSIFLRTGTLTGTGTVDACGMSGGGRGGGGGRIAVYLTNSTTVGAVKLKAYGGDATYDGAAGTIYVTPGTLSHGAGDLIINNSNLTTTADSTTYMPAAPSGSAVELYPANVLLTNGARCTVATQAVDIADLFMNSGTTLYLNNSTLTVHSAEHSLAGIVVSNSGLLIWLPLSIGVSNTYVFEGAGSTTTSAVFTVYLTYPTSNNITFDYLTLDGTGVQPSDYLGTNGSAYVPAGATSTNVAVIVKGDDLIESDETFLLRVTNVTAGVAVVAADGTCIVSNDDGRAISIGDTTIDEGGGATTTNVVFTVTLSQAIGTDVTFSYNTVDGTATSPADYAAASGSGTIQAGQTTTNIVIVVNGDDVPEPVAETFSVVLSSPSGNASLGAGTGVCRIVDYAGTPALSIGSMSVTEGNTGTTNAVLTVALRRPATNTVTFQYDTMDGSAQAPADYTALSGGSGSIPTGQTQATVVVQVNGELWVESNETFYVVLSNASNARILDATGTCSIVNDDYPFVWTGSGGNGLASNTNNWQWNGVKPVRVPTNQDDIILGPGGSSNLTWDAGVNGLTATVNAWAQNSNYSGTVTFKTTYPSYDTTFTNFTILGNCILSNGVWNHLSNAGAANRRWYRLKVTVGGNLLLDSNATVNVTGLGYQSASGPGNPGSHGGQMAQTYVVTFSPANTYGSVTAPIELGSGGIWGGSNDSDGGGAVQLAVGGTATIHGAIRTLAKSSGQVNGAGGSIFVMAGSVAGIGTLDASAVQTTAGGGGGRIAVVVTNSASFGAITMKAFGGLAGPGAAGTIYKESTAHTAGHGILLVDNNNYADAYLAQPYFSYAATLMPTSGAYNVAVNLGDFADIIVTNKGVLGVSRDTTVNLGTANFRFAGRDSSFLAIRGTNGVTWPSPYVITNLTLLIDTNVSVTGDWTVTAQGRISQSASREGSASYSATAGYPFQGPLTLTINGNLTVESNGQVTVQGTGYRCSDGPAFATSSGTRAAGHGGQGGSSDGATVGKTYGSVTNPVTSGSGGFWGGDNTGEGGGAMRLAVSGTTTVNGEIRATALYDDAGAGGSIRLDTGSIVGNGVVDATGYSVAGGSGRGGGGGRIALYLTNSVSFGSVSLRAWGGDSTFDGAPGTIYKQVMGQLAGQGDVVIENGNRTASTNMVTELPPSSGAFADDLRWARFYLTNSAILSLSTNLTIHDLRLATGTQLYLNGNTLTIWQTAPHAFNGTTNGPGQIIWAWARGTLYLAH